MVLTNSKLKCW